MDKGNSSFTMNSGNIADNMGMVLGDSDGTGTAVEINGGAVTDIIVTSPTEDAETAPSLTITGGTFEMITVTAPAAQTPATVPSLNISGGTFDEIIIPIPAEPEADPMTNLTISGGSFASLKGNTVGGEGAPEDLEVEDYVAPGVDFEIEDGKIVVGDNISERTPFNIVAYMIMKRLMTQCTVDIEVIGNGKVATDDADNTVRYGKTITLSFTADQGAKLASVTVNGEEVEVVNGQYTTQRLKTDAKVVVTFADAE